MASAQRLSEDILHAVFLSALPSVVDANESTAPIDLLSIPPLSFSRVCRSWNTLISSSPPLWSSIHINQDPTKPLHPSVIRFVELWFKKSAKAPLDLHFNICQVGDRDRTYSALLNFALLSFERWEKVDIACCGYKAWGTGSRDIALQFSSSVKSIKFVGDPTIGNIYFDISPCWSLVGAYSSLQELSLCRDVTWANRCFHSSAH